MRTLTARWVFPVTEAPIQDGAVTVRAAGSSASDGERT